MSLPTAWRQVGIVVGMVSCSAGTAAAQSFELEVEREVLFGATAGTLVFTERGVDFVTGDPNDVRQWAYEDVKQIQILSETRVAIATYEDQGWVKLGADRTYRFTVTGEPVTQALVQFLYERARKPLVTAVVPSLNAEPRFSVPVKLRRWVRGSHGALELLADALVYRTDRDDHRRYWCLADLHSVFQPDRHRLTVQAYEGGGDRVRAFEFDLKTPLPPEGLDAVWAGMYDPSSGRVGC